MKFIADPALGKLAKWLRILGYDTLYWRGNVEGLLQRAEEEQRVVLTRTRQVSKRAEGRCQIVEVKRNSVEGQLKEVIEALKLEIEPDKILGRCLICNVELRGISPEEVLGRVPDYIYRTHREFAECPGCKRVFWAGTHYERMWERLRRVLDEDNWRGF